MFDLDLSIIIVNFNAKEMLLECLQSISETVKIVSYEIFVIDNASSDGSAEAIRKRFPKVYIIQNQHNAGFSAACNQPLPDCQGKYILYLNPDTVVLPEAIDTMVWFLDRNSKVGNVGCRLLNTDRSLQPSVRKFPTNLNLVKEHLFPWWLVSKKLASKFSPLYWDHNQTKSVDWIIGACLMTRQSLIEKLGVKDENFSMFYEEADWCIRCAKAGFSTYFLSEVSIIHHGSPLIQSAWGERLVLQYYRSKHRLIKKHYGSTHLFFHRILMTGLLSGRLILTAFKAAFGLIPKNQIKDIFLFFLDGITLQILGFIPIRTDREAMLPHP